MFFLCRTSADVEQDVETSPPDDYVIRQLTVSLFQFITLAGLHSNAYISNKFASQFSTEGMEAYVRLIQGPEAEEGCDVLTHQSWSGANYIGLCSISSLLHR